MSQFPPLVAALLGVLLGLAVGSYLATVLVRWPRGESANRGRSRCDGCARQLSWHELVPLASFVAARGACRSCKTPISPVHPAMEAICAAAGAGLFALGAPTLVPMAWLLIALAVCDGLYLWLPDRLVLPLAAASLIAVPLVNDTPLSARLLGGLVGFGALTLVAAVFRGLTGRTGLGGGDPKLFGAIGLWTGWLHLPLVMLLACMIGFADALVRALRGGDLRRMRLPLGSYLCGAVMGLVAVKAAEVAQLNAMPMVTLS